MSEVNTPAWLESARGKGYLLSKSRPAKERLKAAWQRDCLSRREPYVVAWRGHGERERRQGRILVELSGGWWLSRRLWSNVERHFAHCLPQRTGNSFHLVDLPAHEVERSADELVALLRLYRPTAEEAFDLPPALVRGYARCVYNDAMEDYLTEGEHYLIREIPNMMGHVLVLRNGELPLVGIHLDRFELVSDQTG